MGLGASEVMEGGASVALMESSTFVRVWLAGLLVLATIVIGQESSMLLLIKLQ
jgi:hypothetical protein